MFLLIFLLGTGVAMGLIRARSRSAEEQKLLEDNWEYITQKVDPATRYFLLRLHTESGWAARTHGAVDLKEIMSEMGKEKMTEITLPGFYFVYDRLSPIPLASRRVK